MTQFMEGQRVTVRPDSLAACNRMVEGMRVREYLASTPGVIVRSKPEAGVFTVRFNLMCGPVVMALDASELEA